MKPQNYFYTSAFLIFACFFMGSGPDAEIAIYIALGLALLFAIGGVVTWIKNRSKK